MRSLLSIGLVATALYFPLANTAALADKPGSSDAFRWSGFYAGAYIGHAWGESDIRTDAGVEKFAPPTYFATADIDAIKQLASGSVRPDAFIGGVQVGTNLQRGQFVFGLEADVGAFNLQGARGGVYDIPIGIPAQGVVRAAIDTDWLFTARGRVGWTPSSNLLIFATGGLAVTEVRISNSYTDNAPSAGVGGASSNKMMIGWALGGGAEWALTQRWSLKAEYMHVNFGSVSTHGTVFCGPSSSVDCTGAIPSPLSTSADLSADIARVGVNYKFH
jgi:outer membrane immunogenic protein